MREGLEYSINNNHVEERQDSQETTCTDERESRERGGVCTADVR